MYLSAPFRRPAFRVFITALRRVAMLLALAGLSTASTAGAAPVDFTGDIGADFPGITMKETTVGYDASAPISNFSSPVGDTSGAPYDVYVGGDSSDFYVALETTSQANIAGDFANLYLSTDPSLGTNIGFEVSDQVAFIPGGSNTPYNTDPANTLPITFLLTDPDPLGETTIEFGVPWSFFENDPLTMGFETATPGVSSVQMRDTQSFGYTYTGGDSFGADRFGSVLVPTPEPASWLLMALGSLGLYAIARRRRRAAA